MKKREKKNLKILVTGGAGFIGAHLSNSLIASGHKVLIVDALRSQGGIPFINKKIAIQRKRDDVESLNVAVATGILLYQFTY